MAVHDIITETNHLKLLRFIFESIEVVDVLQLDEIRVNMMV